jgi:hypothetical protein
LPEGIVLEGLTTVIIKAGIWEKINAMLSWLASCCPKLIYIFFDNHTRVTTKIFIEGLLRNETFRDKFESKLKGLIISKFNLIKEDARYILFDVVQPFYTGIFYLYFSEDDIQSIQSLGTAAETLTAIIKSPITSNLVCLIIEENLVFENLKSSESTDHKAAVRLVKSFPKLWPFGCYEENLKISSIINYQAMINQSGLRYLLEDSKGGGGTRLSI